MKKLPMAAFLRPEHPSFFWEALQDLANFHDISVLRRSGDVNAEPQNSLAPGQRPPICKQNAPPASSAVIWLGITSTLLLAAINEN